jgi:hypothetical protein
LVEVALEGVVVAEVGRGGEGVAAKEAEATEAGASAAEGSGMVVPEMVAVVSVEAAMGSAMAAVALEVVVLAAEVLEVAVTAAAAMAAVKAEEGAPEGLRQASKAAGLGAVVAVGAVAGAREEVALVEVALAVVEMA